MRNVLLILLALTVVVGPARAQSEPGTQILVAEEDGWRVHLGDSPTYAAPNFDDSAWQQTTFGNDLPDSLLKGHSRWFRKRIALPAQAGLIDLLLIGTQGSFEIYRRRQTDWRSNTLVTPLAERVRSSSFRFVAVRRLRPEQR